MAFPFKILLVEPESHAILFFLTNLMVLIYVLFSIVTWPYKLLYLIIHLTIMVINNKRIRGGRLYIPTKNLNKQTVIVTGAAAGIGRDTALQLAKLQARVIVGIRGQQRAERIAQELSRESHGNVIGYHLDLSDLSSVKQFAEKIDKVDILINNAGVLKTNEELTKDGIESTFGTNHIGHFYLTQYLLPLLIQSKGRIVNVCSLMHIFTNENVDFSKSTSYNSIAAYSKSKLANILHVIELQKRYGDRGIKAYALHPGNVHSSELGRERSLAQMTLLTPNLMFSKSTAQGAMTTLYCALSDEAQPGKYHSDCRVTQASPVAYNSKLAGELWKLSENIVNEKTKHL